MPVSTKTTRRGACRSDVAKCEASNASVLVQSDGSGDLRWWMELLKGVPGYDEDSAYGISLALLRGEQIVAWRGPIERASEISERINQFEYHAPRSVSAPHRVLRKPDMFRVVIEQAPGNDPGNRLADVAQFETAETSYANTEETLLEAGETLLEADALPNDMKDGSTERMIQDIVEPASITSPGNRKPYARQTTSSTVVCRKTKHVSGSERRPQTRRRWMQLALAVTVGGVVGFMVLKGLGYHPVRLVEAKAGQITIEDEVTLARHTYPLALNAVITRDGHAAETSDLIANDLIQFKLSDSDRGPAIVQLRATSSRASQPVSSPVY
ncbi:hypothetical protein GC176_28215 [bacterium]|nr:hypothetical protein [bacterium]